MCTPIAIVSPQHEGRVCLAHVVVKVDNAKAPVERTTHSWKWMQVGNPPFKVWFWIHLSMQLPWTWWWDLPNQLHDCHQHCRHPGNECFGPEGRTKGLEQQNRRKWIITSREFMCNFDPHRPWLSFSSLVNSSMSTCVQIENIFCREINLTCLGVNVVVAGKKVWQTHYEESKTEDLCY